MNVVLLPIRQCNRKYNLAIWQYNTKKNNLTISPVSMLTTCSLQLLRLASRSLGEGRNTSSTSPKDLSLFILLYLFRENESVENIRTEDIKLILIKALFHHLSYTNSDDTFDEFRICLALSNVKSRNIRWRILSYYVSTFQKYQRSMHCTLTSTCTY